MIVVAIIGILAAIAVPNFITYRNKSLVSSAVATGEGVRAAIAAFAADSAGNLYPTNAQISSYATLQTIANANGGTLPTTGTFTVTSYKRFDADSDGVDDDYTMRFVVTGVPTSLNGNQLLVSPQSILKCTGAATATCS